MAAGDLHCVNFLLQLLNTLGDARRHVLLTLLDSRFLLLRLRFVVTSEVSQAISSTLVAINLPRVHSRHYRLMMLRRLFALH